MSADSHVGNAGSILLTLWFDLRGSKSEVPIASLWEEPGYLSSNRPRIESLRGLRRHWFNGPFSSETPWS